MNKKIKLINLSKNKKRMLDADTFQYMLRFLDVSTINEMRTTETYFNTQILKSKRIYRENYLKQVWGNYIIIDLLKLSTDNYKKDLGEFFEEGKKKSKQLETKKPKEKRKSKRQLKRAREFADIKDRRIFR